MRSKRFHFFKHPTTQIIDAAIDAHKNAGSRISARRGRRRPAEDRARAADGHRVQTPRRRPGGLPAEGPRRGRHQTPKRGIARPMSASPTSSSTRTSGSSSPAYCTTRTTVKADADVKPLPQPARPPQARPSGDDGRVRGADRRDLRQARVLESRAGTAPCPRRTAPRREGRDSSPLTPPASARQAAGGTAPASRSR